GVPIAHSVLALKSLLKGLKKLELNESRMEVALEANWAVVSEAIQTILRREGYPKPYEKMKELTRKNSHIGKEEIQAFIKVLDVKDEVKKELLSITPQNYTGTAGK